ncbi:hypothetical protein F5141DRAFT_1060795 [Pisolithus sp. B1]|nr:hypothetical protein F5141DRAFT_1060795 [Pisolithus sp. B1]
MSEEQQQRVHFYCQVDIVPISPQKQLRPYPVSPADEGTSSSENRSEATHCPSMEASTSVDQSQTLQLPCTMQPSPPQPPPLVDHPHQSTSIEVADGQTQPSMITGDAPTPDEHQALEQAGLAMSDADDDFLCTLQTFKSQHGADFLPAHFPYNKQLDGHIISWVQNVQAGQYTVDMINLLERWPLYTWGAALRWYANLCLDMKELEHLILVTISQESFSPILPACFHAYLWCQEDQMIDEISLFIPNWMPRSPNKYAGFVFPWWVDGSLQYMADFKQMRGTRIFPIAHEYFQWLSMGDWIDEWMEEKVSAYMIAVRGVVHELEKNE